MMELSANPEPAQSAAPDWETQRDEIHCPMCEYLLRGLTEPRCPECGYRFEWKDLLDAKIRPHPYLFEHHPEANFKSFWKTAWGGLRPGKFWRTLHAAQPSKPRRLIAYWMLAMLLASLALGGFLVMLWVDGTQQSMFLRAQFQKRSFPGGFGGTLQFQSYINRVAPLPAFPGFILEWWRRSIHYQAIAILTLLFVAWPWMTFGVLMIFGTSMRRARVRSIHVLRCALYSFDIALWVGPLLLLGFVGTAFFETRTGAGAIRSGGTLFGPGLTFLKYTHATMAALLLVACWRLVVAYRRYLKFDFSLATVISSQIILLLLLAVIAANIQHEPLPAYWRQLMGF